MYKTYDEVLKDKQRQIQPGGFKPNYMPDDLFPFQQFVTERAIMNGRFAIFAGMGMGKTRMQLVFAHNCIRHTNKPALILCPLAVSGQTIKEGEKIGIEVKRLLSNSDAIGISTVTTTHQLAPAIYICNYEQLENIAHLTHLFSCLVMDESSLIKSHEGYYRNALISTFKNTHYKLPCTATPSPNDVMELGNHSELLNAMTRNEMLAMFFVHDGGETSKWRLKGHAQDIFWRYVTNWALIINKPSNIGFSDTGYDLPPLHYHVHEIKTEVQNGKMFNESSVSATGFNAELRKTKEQRINKAAEIVLQNNEQHLIWIKHNDEGQMLQKILPGAIEVQGSDRWEYKEEMLLGFASGDIKHLITKTKIAGHGLNYQNCNHTTFCAPDFSFEQTYQGIGRFHRFGNTKPVHANFVVVDTMANIITEFNRKKKQHEDMISITQKYVHDYQMQQEKPVKTTQQIKLPTWL